MTAAIGRLIEVMKQQDLLTEDIKEEYRRLVREKERLQVRCEKRELDVERRGKRVLDADLIRRHAGLSRIEERACRRCYGHAIAVGQVARLKRPDRGVDLPSSRATAEGCAGSGTR